MLTSGDQINLATAAATFLAGLVAAIAIFYTLRLRRELSLDQKLGNVTALFHSEYLDRKLDHPVDLPDEKKTKTDRIEVIRDFVRQKFATDKNFAAAFADNSIKFGTWEYVFVEELMHGLQDLGIAVASGALPLPLVLADAGHVILEDYSYAITYLKLWREQSCESLHASENSELFWSRRHGEWIVHVAVIFIARNWACPATVTLIQRLGLDLDKCLRRERAIRMQEWQLFPRDLQRELSDLRAETVLSRVLTAFLDAYVRLRRAQAFRGQSRSRGRAT